MNQFLDAVLSQLKKVFDAENLGNMIAAKSVNFLVAVIVLLAFYLIWLVVRSILLKYLPRRVDRTTASFITAIVKYVILSIALITALDAIGIKTAAVLASLGVAGLTIGFAARDAFSNLISGVMIYLDRPFVIGDLVEIDGKYGRVEQITLRSTRIVTVDGKMLAVPNADVINKTVTSYTNFPHLRLDVKVTVAVTEDLGRVRKVLLSLVTDKTVYMSEPAPRVIVSNLNDYNVELQLQVWIKDENKHIERRFELREYIFNALNQAGVQMPYETIQLAPLSVKIDQVATDVN